MLVECRTELPYAARSLRVPLEPDKSPPKLTVVSHFPVANDTIKCAMNSVQEHFPNPGYPILNRDILWSTDLMVLSVKKEGLNPTITQRNRQCIGLHVRRSTNIYTSLNPPKYPTSTDQLDLSTLIHPGDDTYCDNGY